MKPPPLRTLDFVSCRESLQDLRSVSGLAAIVFVSVRLQAFHDLFRHCDEKGTLRAQMPFAECACTPYESKTAGPSDVKEKFWVSRSRPHECTLTQAASSSI